MSWAMAATGLILKDLMIESSAAVVNGGGAAALSQFAAANYNRRMTSPSSDVRLGPFRLSPAAAGAVYCLVAVLGYGAANACMRDLTGCVKTWIICNKELITVVVVGPWLAWQVWRGKLKVPTGRPLAALVAAGLTTELIGNLGTQWGYEVVGLAVMIPANTGFVLVATAILGALLLGEHVSARNAAVIALLLVALALLGYGTAQSGAERQYQQAASEQVPPPSSKPEAQASGVVATARLRDGLRSFPSAKGISPAKAAAAIGVAGMCGVVFSLLAIAIRYAVNKGTSLSAAVVIITATGVVTLGPISLSTVGPQALLAMSWQQYAIVYIAGVCNLVAFLAVVKGLQLTTVLHVNMMINAGQIALAAVAGVLMFGESCNRWIALGVMLMIAGIFAFGSPVSEEAVEAPV